MVGVISGKDLGVFNSSLDVLNKNSGQSTLGQANGRDYVNIATGNLSIQFLDKALSGTGEDLLALRTYNSMSLLTDGDADGWRWNGEARLKLVGTLNAAGSSLTRTLGDGNQSVYAWNGTAYVSTAGADAHDTITWNGVNEYLWAADGSGEIVERYDSSTGWIKNRRDGSGNGFDFVFSGDKLTTVKDVQSGQSLEFSYGANGKLARLDNRIAAAGLLTQQVYYAYDASNRLASVTTDLTPANNSVVDGVVYVTNYTYDGTSNRIASVSQSDGTLVNFTYDASGRVATVIDQSGTSTFTYSATSTTVTNGVGDAWVYSFDADKQLTKVQAPGAVLVSAYTYDTAGNVTSSSDGRGNLTSYTFDANGNATKEVDSLGNTVTRTFSSNNVLLTETAYTIPSSTAPSGAETTRFVYDSASRLRFVVSAQGRVSETRYSSLGLVTQRIQYTGGLYDLSLLTPTTGLSETQLTTWIAAQNKTQTQLSEFTYDYRGNLTKKIDYATVSSAGAGVLDAAADVTEYVYDEYGQLLQTFVDRGATRTDKVLQSSVLYDGLGRQISVVTDTGTTTTLYNGVQTTVSNSASGLTSVTTTDSRGRVTSFTNSGDFTSRSTTYAYDAAGRLRITQDPTGARSYIFYDTASRVSAKVDGLGDMVAFTYNADNQVLTETRYATRLSVTTWLDIASTPSTITPTIDATNDRLTTYTYDAAGRLTTTVIAGGLDTITNTYDGESQLTQTTQGTRTTRYFYDKDGLQIGQLNAENYLSENVYDGVGRLVKSITYGTQVTTVDTFAVMKAAVVAKPSLASYFYYDGEGRLVGSVDTQGFLTETVYDAVNNRRQSMEYTTAVTATDTSTLATLRSLAGTSETTTTNFDKYGRVDTQVGVDGSTNRNVYDANGRLVRQVLAEGTTDQRTTRFRYNPLGEVTGTVSGLGESTLTANPTVAEINSAITSYGTRYDIDGMGRKIAEYHANDQKTYLFYNTAGQLVYTVNTLGEVSRFAYNAFGQITQVQAYTGRIDVTGLTGGVVTTALTTKIAAIANTATDKIVTTTYNKLGLVDTATDAEGFKTVYGYNTYGEVLTERQDISSTTSVLSQWGRDKLGRAVSSKQDADVGGLNITTSQTVYDGFGRVQSVTDAKGLVTTTQYLDNGRTLLITDPTSRTTKSEVDFQGRTLKTYDGFNNVTAFSYNNATRSVTMTSPDGTSITTTKTRTGDILSVTDGKGGVTTYSYTKDGQLKSVVNALSQTISDNSYDNSGRLIQTKDANGNVTAYTYDAADRVIQKAVDPTGLNLKTTYTFDGQGRQISVTAAAGTADAVTSTYTYDRNGQLTKIITDSTGLALSTRFTYDGAGQVTKMEKGNGTDPAQQTTTYAFDKLGRKVSETVDPSGLNITTAYQYDNNGNLTQKNDANGNVTRFVYDGTNRLRFIVDAEGGVSEKVYDANGNAIKTVRYATAVALSGALTEALVNLSVVRTTSDQSSYFTYDKNNRVHFTVNAEGAVTESLYDANGNIIKTVEFAAIPSFSADYSDTAINSMVDRTNTGNHTTYYAYDSANQLRFRVTAEGTFSETVYDAAGNVVAVTEFAAVPNLLGTYTYANISASVDRTNSANRVTNYAYDKAGQLRYTVNAEGYVRENTYDARGNVIKTIAFAGVLPAVANYGESAIKAVLNYADANNQVINYVYDKNNRVRFTVDSENYVSENNYDAMGNVVSFTRFSSRIAVLASYTEATVNAAVNRTDTYNHTTNTIFDKLNRLRYSITAEGVVTETRYDASGNKTQTTQFAAAITVPASVTETAINGLLDRANVGNRTQVFQYNKNNQLRFLTDAEGSVTENVYDVFGNIAKTIRYAGGVTSSIHLDDYYTYDRNNRLHFAINAEGAVSESVRDAFGNVTLRVDYATAPNLLGNYSDANINATVNRTNTNNHLTYFTYTKNSQLHFAVNAEGGVAETLYDAFGNSIKTIQFAAAPNLLGDYSDTNINAKVDRTNANNRINYVTFDRINRAHFTVNAEGAVSENNYDAFGNIIKTIQFAAVPNLLGNYSDANINTSVDRTNTKNRTSYFTYDKNNRLHFTVNAENAVSVRSYDASGNVIKVTAYASIPSLAGNYSDSNIAAIVNNTDVNNRTTNYAFDKNNRLRFVIDGENYVSETTYDTAGNVASLTQFAASLAVQTNYALATVSAAVNRADANNRVTTYQYDRANRQIKTTLAGWYDVSDGRVYASLGTETDRFQRTIEVTYDAFGNAVANKMRMGLTDYNYQYKTYDKLNRVVHDVDALGFVSQNTYDLFGNVKTITRSGSAIAAKTSGYWLASDITIPAGRIISVEFDKLGRKTKITQPTTSNLYLSQGSSFANSGGGAYYTQASTMLFTYDALGNLVKQNTAINNAVSADVYFYYDKVGQQILSVNSENYGTKTEYNAFGDVSKTLEYANKSSTAPVVGTPPVFVLSTTDRETVQTFDGLGHVKTISRRINGGATNMQVAANMFNAFGEVVTSQDADRNITRSEYNRVGKQTKVVEPTRQVGGTGVDVFIGQRSQSPTTVFNYDAFGQVVSRTQYEDVTLTNGRIVAFGYDLAGNQTEVTTITGLYSYQNDYSTTVYLKYDVAGHILSQKQDIAVDSAQLTYYMVSPTSLAYAYTIERRFEYDKTGRQVANFDILGTQKTGQVDIYNAYGEVIEQRKVWGAATDLTSTLLATELNNAIVTSYSYDAAGRVQWKRGQDGYTFYFYDLLGNVTRTELRGANSANTSTARVTEYFYDKLGRSLFQRLPQYSATTAFGATATTLYTPSIYQVLDRWGNVTFRQEGGSYVSYEYNQDNQVVVEGSALQKMIKIDGTTQDIYHTKKSQYDVSGHLTRVTDAAYVYGTNTLLGTQVWQNTYNAAGQLIQAEAAYGSSAATMTRYTYDAFGNRIGTLDALGHVTVDMFDKKDQLIRHDLVRNGYANEYSSGQVGATPTRIMLTSYTYDQAGRQWAVGRYNLDNSRAGYQFNQYDERNNLVKSINEVGVTKTIRYDIINNKIGEKSGSSWVYQHEQTWNFNSASPYGGVTTDYADYQVNTATSHTVEGYQYAYTYNDWGQVLTEAIGGSNLTTKTYSYWENGLQKSVRDTGNWAYDWPGTLYYLGQTDYFFDTRGNRSAEHNLSRYSRSNVTSFYDSAYDAANSQVLDDTYAYFGFDSANRLSKVKSTSADIRLDNTTYVSPSIQLMTYDYDEWGNRRRIQSNYTIPGGGAQSKAEWFAYDGANRVTVEAGSNRNGKIVASNEGGRAYTYDRLGRRVTEEVWTEHREYGGSFENYDFKTFVYSDLGMAIKVDLYENVRDAGYYYFDEVTGDDTWYTSDIGTTAFAAKTSTYMWTDTATYDNRGFKMSTESYDAAKTNTRRVAYTYNADGSLSSQSTTYNGALESSLTNYVYANDRAGQLLSYESKAYTVSGATSTFFGSQKIEYSYTSSSAGQQVFTISAYSTTSGASDRKETRNYYDYRGRLIATTVPERSVNYSTPNDIGLSTRKFAYNAAAQVVTRAEKRYGSAGGYSIQNYFYTPAGAEITDLGTISGANLSPLDAVNSGGDTPLSYTVNGGDTLMSIALSVFGDAQYWYVIADANGLVMGPTTSFSPEDIGRTLRIPNGIRSIRSTSSNYKPYSAADVQGNQTPSANFIGVTKSTPTPLPQPQNNGCSSVLRIIAIIVVIVVAVVVTVYTAGAATAAIAPALVEGGLFATGAAAIGGTLAATATITATEAILIGMAAAAIGGFVGSVASQYVGKALGVVDEVSWKQAAVSGLTAGLGAGAGAAISAAGKSIGMGKLAIGAAKGAANYSLTYATSNIVGMHMDFKWSEMATSMFAGSLAEGSGNYGMGDSLGAGFANDMINSTATFGFSRLVTPDKEKFSWGMASSAAADAFGNALGNSIVKGMVVRSSKAAGVSEESVDETSSEELQQIQKQEQTSVTPSGASQAVEPSCAESESAAMPPRDANDTTHVQPEVPVAVVPEPETYSVKQNDTYWNIARKTLGKNATKADVLEYTKKLMSVNKTETLHPGQTLVLPGEDTLVSAEANKQYNEMDARYRKALRVQEANRQAAEAEKQQQLMQGKRRNYVELSSADEPAQFRHDQLSERDYRADPHNAYYEKIKRGDKTRRLWRDMDNGQFTPRPNQKNPTKMKKMDRFERDFFEVKAWSADTTKEVYGTFVDYTKTFSNENGKIQFGPQDFVKGTAKTEFLIDRDGLGLKNEIAGEAGILWLQGDYDLGKFGKVEGNIRSSAEAYGAVDLTAKLKNGSAYVQLEGRGGAQAVLVAAQASWQDSTGVLGVGVKTTANVEGHLIGVGGTYTGGATYHKGKFKLYAGGGLTALIGGKVKGGVELDFSHWYKTSKDYIYKLIESK